MSFSLIQSQFTSSTLKEICLLKTACLTNESRLFRTLPSFRIIRLCLVVLLCSFGSPHVYSAGLTVITHGFASATDSWILEMGDAIMQRIEFVHANMYQLIIEDRGLPGGELSVSLGDTFGKAPTSQPKTSDSGETIVLLCWSDIDNHLGLEGRSTQVVARSAVTALLRNDLLPEFDKSVMELPTHFIGHSRGASLVTEMARLLGRRGIQIDHITTLDPRPIGDPDFDASVAIGNNIVFADNFFRSGCGVPDGRQVPFTHEIDLSGIVEDGFCIGELFVPHIRVHTFYHGTIGTDFNGEVDGQIIDPAWYSHQNTSPRDRIGYFWSRIVGGNRPADGLAKAFGGTAERTTVDTDGSPQWPNIGDIKTRNNRAEFAVAETIPFSFRYQDNALRAL